MTLQKDNESIQSINKRRTWRSSRKAEMRGMTWRPLQLLPKVGSSGLEVYLTMLLVWARDGQHVRDSDCLYIKCGQVRIFSFASI